MIHLVNEHLPSPPSGFPLRTENYEVSSLPSFSVSGPLSVLCCPSLYPHVHSQNTLCVIRSVLKFYSKFWLPFWLHIGCQIICKGNVQKSSTQSTIRDWLDDACSLWYLSLFPLSLGHSHGTQLFPDSSESWLTVHVSHSLTPLPTFWASNRPSTLHAAEPFHHHNSTRPPSFTGWFIRLRNCISWHLCNRHWRYLQSLYWLLLYDQIFWPKDTCQSSRRSFLLYTTDYLYCLTLQYI